MLADDTVAILRAILKAGDYGVLLTDLNHRSLACNERFGEIWGVNPHQVVSVGVNELRKMVRRLIPNPDAWVQRLDQIYADPEQEYEDELTLLSDPPKLVRRFSGPVRSPDGTIIGRIWTFRDITRMRRSLHMQEVLHEISTFFDTDPTVVYRKVLDQVSKFYSNSTAILSVRKDDFMEFRAVAGPLKLLELMRGNKLKDAY